jgi:hypothetical protein
MQISLMSLIRLFVLTALVASAAAVGLSRLAPPPRPWRMATPVNAISYNHCFLREGGQGSIWLAKDDGRELPFQLPSDERLDYSSQSPWRDDQGRSQVVGRWTRRSGASEGDSEFGMARVSFPDGEVIDRVPTNVVPLSSPCWYPGTRARVLFAGGDGQLYDYAFESPSLSGSDPSPAYESPRQLRWTCDRPGGDGLFLSDPHWPTDPRLSRVVFVSLRFKTRSSGHSAFNFSEIWWLRLSEDGTAIEEAKRLLDPGPGSAGFEERCPTIGQSPDGTLALAYLRKDRARYWELRKVKISLEGTDRRPVASQGLGQKLADGCQPCAPAFLKDGRHIMVIQAGDTVRGAVDWVKTGADDAASVSTD